MNEYKSFGEPARFCLRVRWSRDSAAVDQRPIPHGWSMGCLDLLVGNLSLTAHDVEVRRRHEIEWYLGPFLHWLADNWVPLFHEELFSWTRPPSGPASVSVERSLNYWSKYEDDRARREYRAVQAWYLRHCMASASSGGLFPNVYIRRFLDQVEVSWTGQPPEFAPRGLQFQAAAGVARLSVSEVADPLWDLLQWATHCPPELELQDPRYQADWDDLCRKVETLANKPAAELVIDVPHDLLQRVRENFARVSRSELVELKRAENGPYISEKPLAVAMFGGLSPNLADSDIIALRDVLVDRSGQGDSDLLEMLSGESLYRSMGLKPYDDGEEFADYFLDDLEEKGIHPKIEGFVDIHAICERLGIDIVVRQLETADIRGVALAGQGFGPTILINTSHAFNETEAGQRFTIAHEMCHILADRERAKGIGHTSGTWALPSIEKRANAFAAYLLMPRGLVLSQVKNLADIGEDEVRNMSATLRVSFGALAQHLYNLGIIDDVQRDRLSGSAKAGR